MVNTTEPLTGTYQGVELYLTEIEVLEELERLVKQPIRFEFVAKEKHVVELTLYRSNLSKLPDSIGKLKQLQTLNLVKNWFSKLPESIGKLKQLQTLDLSGNQLSTLPDSIGELKQLQELILRKNRFSKLPESIGKLKQLQTLNLWANDLSTLPDSIGELKQLQRLLLGSNRFSTFPDSIGELKQLQRLDLDGNQLSKLPDSIRELKQLLRLDLSSNQITAFSKEQWTFFAKTDSTFHLIPPRLNYSAFKKIFVELSPEEEQINQFMEKLAPQVFSPAQIEELESIIEPDAELFRLGHKTNHQNLLGVGVSLNRAIYGTLIGSGLIRFYDILLGTTLNLPVFIMVIVVLLVCFGLITWLTKKQEQEVRKSREDFVKDCKVELITTAIYLDTDVYQQQLKRKYFVLETEMISARYNVIVGFTSNMIISSITTFVFTLFTTTTDVFSYLITPSEWSDNFLLMTCFTWGIILVMAPSLYFLFTRSIPNLRFNMRKDLNKLVVEYNKIKKDKEKEKLKEESIALRKNHLKVVQDVTDIQ
ncbi:MAG: leucine-rich repeat domain-containing protein [Candidatus Hodarchaeales archaeon]